MAKGNKRDIVILKCTDCGDKNYTTTKNRKTAQGKLELKKFCPRTRTHEIHRESK